MKLKLATFAFAVASLSGCNELLSENDTKPDGSVSDIAVSAPGENSIFTHGQTVPIQSVITDKDNLKQLDVQVANLDSKNGNKPVWGYTDYPKKAVVNQIDTTFSASALPTGNYVLTITTVDGRTNIGKKEINFSVK